MARMQLGRGRTPNRRWILAAALGLAITLVSCGGGEDESASSDASETKSEEEEAKAVTLRGVVSLYPDPEVARVGGFYEPGDPCDAIEHPLTKVPIFSADFEVFAEDATVTATDEAGKIVGTGRLESGTWVALPTDTNLSDHVCEMPFTVDAQPSSFFTLAFGSQESDPISADEASDPVELKFEDSESPAAP